MVTATDMKETREVTHTHPYTHTHTHTDSHTTIHTHTHTRSHTDVHLHTHIHLCTHTHTHILCTHTYTYITYICAHAHTHILGVVPLPRRADEPTPTACKSPPNRFAKIFKSYQPKLCIAGFRRHTAPSQNIPRIHRTANRTKQFHCVRTLLNKYFMKMFEAVYLTLGSCFCCGLGECQRVRGLGGVSVTASVWLMKIKLSVLSWCSANDLARRAVRVHLCAGTSITGPHVPKTDH